MSEYKNEMVKTFTAEATSLNFTYIPYVFEKFGGNDYFLNAA